MTRVREIALMILTAAIIIFAGQNLGAVEVAFLFWNFEVPLALITLVPMLAGLIVGVGATAVKMRKRRGAAAGDDEPEDAEANEEPVDEDETTIES
ncbi:MAG: DUF1049 domain-containing protein [Gemmatimonadota bacterium]|nr:MAG: DUF1049 domain-containing protein [Gemmatimonadota bacterium]